MAGSLSLALLAGILSTLSPCVVPLLPIVLAAAATEHRFGPLALAGGLCLSFVAIGLFVATIGFSLGLDGDIFRNLASVLLLGLGLVLLLSRLQTRLAVAAGPLSRWAERRLGTLSSTGASGQFGVGILLGALWSPCVGPTLGAASLLAAQGRHLGDVALTMGIFGLGAAMPLLLLGTLSRATLMRWRGTVLRTGSGLKAALGVVLIVTALAILSGIDKSVETVLVAASPDWLTSLTSRF